jgi:hypothetical protein
VIKKNGKHMQEFMRWTCLPGKTVRSVWAFGSRGDSARCHGASGFVAATDRDIAAAAGHRIVAPMDCRIVAMAKQDAGGLSRFGKMVGTRTARALDFSVWFCRPAALAGSG